MVLMTISKGSVNGLDRKVDKNEETKVKCKEVVDEALRQYWDHSNGETSVELDFIDFYF